ncbi:MAG: 4-(cytidine 5'-diphospho)-2-C-methyl-D-erythritol kinase, partial [Gaiellales bacterium]
MTATIAAPAKINLALVVGARREDGKHEVVTVYERIALADTLTLEPANDLEIEGFPADTLVALALTSLAAAAEVEPNWRVAIEKRIPVGAGLGGGSSDAAAAMRLANASLAEPFDA